MSRSFVRGEPNVWRMFCDSCDYIDPERFAIRRQPPLSIFASKGWLIGALTDRCPDCRQRADLPALSPARSFSGALGALVNAYTSNGVQFTVAEIAEEIIAEASLPDESVADEAIRRGVYEVARLAVMKSPPSVLRGTTIPRLITVRTEDGKYVRIPVQNATVGHLSDMIAMRREQLAQDQAALQKLEEFGALVEDNSPETRLGPLISQMSETIETEAVA
jgi:hypothetical protein